MDRMKSSKCDGWPKQVAHPSANTTISVQYDVGEAECLWTKSTIGKRDSVYNNKNHPIKIPIRQYQDANIFFIILCAFSILLSITGGD